jgi:hypothetical protein
MCSRAGEWLNKIGRREKNRQREFDDRQFEQMRALY